MPTELFDVRQKLGPNWEPTSVPGTPPWLATPVSVAPAPDLPRLPAEPHLPRVAGPAIPPAATSPFEKRSR
ncbi:MAG: hypothetical protein VXZ82_09675 [Planctomycetota bacterium]|nr:hypothetical protein [Planctomycetota bacterium]